jgi:hypothetical protein
MLLCLKQAWEGRIKKGEIGEADLLDAVREGAVLRMRLKAMTVAVIIVSLIPVMIGSGTVSEVRQRVVAPTVGGMITAFGFYTARRRRLDDKCAGAIILLQAHAVNHILFFFRYHRKFVRITEQAFQNRLMVNDIAMSCRPG